MSKEVFVKMIEWNTKEMAHTAAKIIGFYAMAGVPFSSNNLIRFMGESVLPVIGNVISAEPVRLVGKDAVMVFHGPYQKLIPIINSDEVTWQQCPARFELYDFPLKMSPSRRTQFYDATFDISREVGDVYKIKTTHNPITFSFPEEYYARSVEKTKALLIF